MSKFENHMIENHKQVFDQIIYFFTYYHDYFLLKKFLQDRYFFCKYITSNEPKVKFDDWNFNDILKNHSIIRNKIKKLR